MKCCSASPPSPTQRVVRIVLILAVLVVVVIAFLRTRPRIHEVTGTTMGTTFSVKYVRPAISGMRSQAIRVRIQSCLDQVNGLMSTYQPDSELSQFNAHSDTSPFKVSDRTAEVFRAAIQASEQSGGAFDVTVGPIVNAYGFGPDSRPSSQPTDEQLAILYRRVGYKMIHVDGAMLIKDRPDIYCDLSAIAKGYAVDLIAQMFAEIDIDSYMIEVGGEVRTRGTKPDAKPWRIGIQQPDDDATMVLSVIELQDKAMATSGDYRNFYMVGGRRISHTIDPRTGRPITHNLASVSVIEDECMYADAWATALMVLGPEEGYDLAVKKDLAASFIVRTGAGFTRKSTPAFEKIAQP